MLHRNTFKLINPPVTFTLTIDKTAVPVTVDPGDDAKMRASMTSSPMREMPSIPRSLRRVSSRGEIVVSADATGKSFSI